MSKIFDLICDLQNTPCVSGAESIFSDHLPECFKTAKKDRFGNLFYIKKSTKRDAPKILVEAHRDEIGLCVNSILSGGFVSAVPCGGFDLSSLSGEDFIIFGKERIRAVAAALPPHLAKKDEKDVQKGEILLDTGLLSFKETSALISIGDLVHFSATPKYLSNHLIISRGLDNKASVAALHSACEESIDTDAEICFLYSSGEETSSYGVKTFCREYKPDLAIVVDVGFGYNDGLDKSSCIVMGSGPSISFSDTLSVPMSKWAVSVAKSNGIPYQIICEAGGTGTSATAIQTSCGGVPSVVLSIPLLNMHTAAEIVDERDIFSTVQLICLLIENHQQFLEEVKRYDKQ